MSRKKIPVSVLGATGTVGQRFLQRLDRHPLFEIAALAASGSSVGRTYSEACPWRLDTPLPAARAATVLCAARPGLPSRIVFSALEASIAGPLEEELAEAGHLVFSNASAHRLDPDVPLLIPEVNPDHLRLLEIQRRRRGREGGIVANANCSTMQVALALAPLHRRFGIEKALITTLQSVSGGGYPGVPSLDILGNVIPDIPGEAGKIETETRKILGRLRGESVRFADFALSARTFRVPVEEGHVAAVSVKLSSRATARDLRDAWGRFQGPPAVRRLPSAPAAPVEYLEEAQSPQPRRHLQRGGGMSATVGGLERCGVLDWKFTVLGHNTVRGAAGSSILNAEFFAAGDESCAS